MFKNPVVHGLVAAVAFILPLIVATGGSWQQLTLGGVLTALASWLNTKLTPTA